MGGKVSARLLPLLLALATISADAFTLSLEISDKVPRHLCRRTIANIQDLLRKTSVELDRLTGRPVSAVWLQLPGAWRHAECQDTDDLHPVQHTKTDIIVGGRDPVFGAQPHVLQYGGCTVQGLHIHLPFDTLVQADNITSEIVMDFTRSLLNYKYGIFPVHGFGNDTRYPRYYRLGEVVLENKGCTNGQILCEPEFYEIDAPSKQNLLCDYRSPLQIIRSSALSDQGEPQEEAAEVAQVLPDGSLNHALASLQDAKLNDPKFKFTIKTTTRYILVLENSGKMEKRWTNLHNALHRFIMELDIGDELAVITFSNTTRTNLEPTVITQENKPGIHGRVPGRPGTDISVCVSCALSAASTLIAPAKTTQTKILLVTSGDSPARSAISEDLRVPVYAIAYREERMESLAGLRERGRVFVMEEGDSEHLDLLSDAFLALRADGGLINQRVRKFFHNKYRVVPSEKVEGKFTVEESLRRSLKVVSVTRDKEDIEIFELVSPSGKIHRFPLVERGSVYFEFESLTVETGIWTFTLKLSPSTSKSTIDLSVSAFAEQSTESTVTVSAWSSADTRLTSPLDGPVTLYARLTDGDLPLSGARVTAEVHTPQGQRVEVELRDEGTGYPDITRGDGIYSGYITRFSSEAGFYSLSVRAEDGLGSARIPTQSSGGAEDCCGSDYPVASTIPTPTFTRVVMAPSFYLTQGVELFIRDGVPKVQDIFAPSRITDLRVQEYSEDGLELSLAWTAPGGDFNAGTAARYRIRSYTDRTTLKDENFSQSGIPVHEAVIPVPGSAGTQELCNVTLPWPNEVFYYGIVAMDEAGNTSPVSNLVPVFIREAIHSSESSELRNLTSGSSPVSPASVLDVFEDNLMVYIIAGCITGIVLIILIVILISLRISRSRGASKKPKRECITEISSPTLIHSSSSLTGILKDSSLSVLPCKDSPSGFSLDYTVYKPGVGGGGPVLGRDEAAWSILPAYTNTAFRQSSDTLVDSGYYRAGEQVDNVSEFYRPALDYVTYQNLGLKPDERRGDVSDNGTGTTSSTDCENSETCSDKNLPNFRDSVKDASRSAAAEFHSLIVTGGEGWGQMDGEFSKLSVSGPLSLQGLSEYELQEKRQRRESFV